MKQKITASLLALAILCSCILGPAAYASEQKESAAIAFPALETTLREKNLDILVLEETIASIEALDYDEMHEDIVDNINLISGMQSLFDKTGNSVVGMTLEDSITSLDDTLDDLKDGEVQKDNEDVVRQLKHAQKQLIALAEALYVSHKELELNDAALTTSLAALDRDIAEMERRHDLGQIPSLTLEQLQTGRSSLLSSQRTLRANLSALTMQLESMLGFPLSGTLQLEALPKVSAEELSAMDLEADLKTARENSYDLYYAQLTLEDAEEDFKDSADACKHNSDSYLYISAQHTLRAAEYTYAAEQRAFDLSFRTLYVQVKDYEQVLAAARTALATEEKTFAAAEKKFDLGIISQNELAEAQDKLTEAQRSVETAELELFSTYSTYRRAVDDGVMN